MIDSSVPAVLVGILPIVLKHMLECNTHKITILIQLEEVHCTVRVIESGEPNWLEAAVQMNIW